MLKQFAYWPNVKCVPSLPYEGDKRQDDPFHWGTGQFAALVGMSFKPKAIFLVGMDLYGLGKERKPATYLVQINGGIVCGGCNTIVGVPPKQLRQPRAQAHRVILESDFLKVIGS